MSFNVICYAPRSGYEKRMNGGTFYGSNDGSSWTELYTIGSNPAFEMTYADIGSPKTYRYLRYDVPGELCNIAEIKIYEAK